MGRRWRRNNPKKFVSSSVVSSTTDEKDTTPTTMCVSPNYISTADRKVALSYLQKYKTGAQAFYSFIVKDSDDDTLIGASAMTTYPLDLVEDENSTPLYVGDVALPLLTPHVWEQPFLALPTKLSSKQRKLIHELCLEVGLYHCSVGQRVRKQKYYQDNQRYIAVSIYVDGFESLCSEGMLELDSTSQRALPLYKYRPWFCRRQREYKFGEQKESSAAPNATENTLSPSGPKKFDSVHETNCAAIDNLIKYPGQCLRDDRDSIDFRHLDKQDLSSISLPDSKEDSSWMLVDSAEKMNECLADLLEHNRPSELAFDLECHNKSKYAQLTCLLQIATDAGKTYIIDTLATGVWDLVPELGPLFSNPSIVKVGHCIGGLDTFSLHRDFGIFVVNAFDTYEAAQVLQLPSHGLDAVCQYYGIQDSEKYIEMKKTYQNGDWHVRPLTPSMIQYARYDVHFLLSLRRLMMRDCARGMLFDRFTSEDKNEPELVPKKLADVVGSLSKEDQERKDRSSSEGGDSVEPQGALTDDDDEDASFNTSVGNINQNSSLPAGIDEGFFTPTNLSRNNSFIKSTSKTSTVVEASVLRLQPKLLRVLSQSQHRCKALWSGGTEPHMKNSFFETLFRRARKGEIVWTPEQTNLYKELVLWRSQIAFQEHECLVDFVAPLDFLASIAWRRPRSVEAMRLISHDLPAVLEDKPEYLQHIFELINKSFQNQSSNTGFILAARDVNDETIFRFSDLEKYKKRRLRIRNERRNAWRTVAACATITVLTVLYTRLNRNPRIKSA